jgi:UDP-N-acetylmuramoyl-tripeptide--D-alanyl-D-alanine ligase
VAEPLWTSVEIERATGGTASGPFAVQGVSIDSRAIAPGDLFVALSGVRDGHDFVETALAQGAAATLVARPVTGPHLTVTDVLKGLEDMGLAARDRCAAKRCAVTGSVGKTSVTQAIRAGLALAGKAHSSVKSYNNHIGVPLTLARMPRDAERAVFEIGMNHAGEIEPLAGMVAPHVVVITKVGPVHTENFPDGEAGVARAKAEIFSGLKRGGTAILNADNGWYPMLRAEAEKAGAKVWTFGSDEACDARLLDFTVGELGHVRAVIGGEAMAYTLRQTADHWGMTSLCVLLALQAMDVPRATAIEAMSNFEPLEGRGTVVSTGGFTLIDESYNANPISMASAIRSLGARPAEGRRIVALTDMLELGPRAASFHADLAKDIEAACVDLVFCAGPLMKSLWESLSATRQGGYAMTAAELAPLVGKAVRPGDVVMVKGSNGSAAHLIAKTLRAKAAEGAG